MDQNGWKNLENYPIKFEEPVCFSKKFFAFSLFSDIEEVLLTFLVSSWKQSL